MENYKNYDHMTYQGLKSLRKINKSWKLLASINGAFIIAFLYEVFIVAKKRDIPEGELVIKLQYFIEENKVEAERTPKEYLSDWTSDDYGLLRKFMPIDHDEAMYDLTPEGQKAIDWIASLKQEEFIGSESRLISVFNMLDEIVIKTNEDPKQRIEELEKQKQEIDQEIEEIKKGKMKLLEPVQIKERYIQAMKLSRDIISDFRQVEQNFRMLDRKVKEDITSWQQGKGAFLDHYFEQEDAIDQSPQGQSFTAFWNFLMSKSQHAYFIERVHKITQLDVIQEIDGYKDMLEIESRWIQEGDHVQKTISSVSKQLKRYLDENYLEEEKRINQLILNIENIAIELKENRPKHNVLELEIPSTILNLPLERPLFTPPVVMKMNTEELQEGQFDNDCLDSLYNHQFVDKQKLKDKIQMMLEIQSQVTLVEVLETNPLELGLVELLTYLEIAGSYKNNKVENNHITQLSWFDTNSNIRQIDFPNIIYKNVQEEV